MASGSEQLGQGRWSGGSDDPLITARGAQWLVRTCGIILPQDANTQGGGGTCFHLLGHLREGRGGREPLAGTGPICRSKRCWSSRQGQWQAGNLKTKNAFQGAPRRGGGESDVANIYRPLSW
jgi:hypothetical protein